MALIEKRSIREVFDFGFEQMNCRGMVSNKNEKFFLHREDFAKGGKFEKFLDYPLWKFREQFGMLVSWC